MSAKGRGASIFDIVTRFWAHVDRSVGDACWPWRKGKDKDGYGKFQFGPNGKQTHLRAHRFALFLSSGEFGDVTLHSCDVPACCNPKHLRWATQKENRVDCMKKGRTAKGDRHGSRTKPEALARGARHWTKQKPELIVRGSKHHRAVFTDVQVADIRARYIRYGRVVGALAREFGVDRSTIRKIARGETY